MMNELILTPINGEPRIRDLDLAERLGFERPALAAWRGRADCRTPRLLLTHSLRSPCRF